jgi:hypothetical protein
VWDNYVKNFNLRDLSDESNNQSEICASVDVSNSVNNTTMADPSTSHTIFDDFCTMKEKIFQQPQDCMVGNLSSSQDGQSQITSASLAESHAFPLRDNSGGTSSSHVDFDESSFLNNNSWKQVTAPIRTYTKVTFSFMKCWHENIVLFNMFQSCKSIINMVLLYFVTGAKSWFCRKIN